MKVWIVSKMLIHNRVWIHGLTEENKHVRLLTNKGQYPSSGTKFEVGQLWDLIFHPATTITPPHTEDVLVTHWKFLGQEDHLLDVLTSRVKIWHTLDELFDGALSTYIDHHKMYLSEKQPLPISMGYWLTDAILLKWHSNSRNEYPCYRYHNEKERIIDYTGFGYTNFVQQFSPIPKNTLVHVSLGKWWTPHNTFATHDSSKVGKRCYLQISDWYMQ
ncbi:hypothetical protein KDW_38770 [Dictyobacter vulcani]|uniref:Dual OB-containing domain-containing protein n=1 Tax=Dictyobacter vulcani TaxID=2607529 RepID=A0A5J4KPB5_9CHLR|nr:hypothetical protein [Dictyobacter vulcani]GER89715.1 hypothetical protein KDW_38770 [Dictyobacter vulcani]